MKASGGFTFARSIEPFLSIQKHFEIRGYRTDTITDGRIVTETNIGPFPQPFPFLTVIYFSNCYYPISDELYQQKPCSIFEQWLFKTQQRHGTEKFGNIVCTGICFDLLISLLNFSRIEIKQSFPKFQSRYKLLKMISFRYEAKGNLDKAQLTGGLIDRMTELPSQSDRYSNHDDHVDEAGTDEICREHPVPFARILQQIVHK